MFLWSYCLERIRHRCTWRSDSGITPRIRCPWGWKHNCWTDERGTVNDPLSQSSNPQPLQSQTRNLSNQMTSETYSLLCNDPYIKFYFLIEGQKKAKDSWQSVTLWPHSWGRGFIIWICETSFSPTPQHAETLLFKRQWNQFLLTSPVQDLMSNQTLSKFHPWISFKMCLTISETPDFENRSCLNRPSCRGCPRQLHHL